MPFTQGHTDKKIHLSMGPGQTVPTQLTDALSESMGAESVQRVDSPSVGSIFAIKLPADHIRKEYFKHDEWTNDWYSGAADSIIVLSKGTDCTHHTNDDMSSTAELGRGHIMTLSSRGASTTGIVDVGLIEGSALCRHRGNDTWVAITRSSGESHINDSNTIWHKVKPSPDSSAWPWVVSRYAAAP